jgi:DNA polymerase-1
MTMIAAEPKSRLEHHLRAIYETIMARMPSGSLPWAEQHRPDLWEALNQAEDTLNASVGAGDRVERMAVEGMARAYGNILDAYQTTALAGFDDLFGAEKEPSCAGATIAGGGAARQSGPPPVAFALLTTPDEVTALAEQLQSVERLAVDVETTGLNPRKERTRLLSVATEQQVWLVDLFQTSLEPLLPILNSKPLLGHNLVFDLGFLAPHGVTAESAEDTMLLSQLAASGERMRHGLGFCVERELGFKLDKTLQTSDWRRALSPKQLEYAARDTQMLFPLRARLLEKLEESGQTRVAAIESRCLLTLAWMARNGVGVDADTWGVLVEEADRAAVRVRAAMDELAPRSGVLFQAGRDWDSPQKVLESLQELGLAVGDTTDATLAACDHPLADAIREYRGLRKLVTSYGQNWLDRIEAGRFYPDWQQMGSRAGRMSCREPNVQQVPRDKRYRACIKAGPGHVLIKADYSQIELRIAAKIAGEARMLAAYQSGEDLHTLTAQMILEKGAVTGEDRQIAKSLNFGLLYGMGANGLRSYAKATFGVTLTENQATRYRTKFFQAYPGLKSWHDSTRAERPNETSTLSGRVRILQDTDPDTFRLNTPVQGTGADGLKRALALLWSRRKDCPGAFPVIAAHDEIVLECPEDQAEAATGWLRSAMLDGMERLVQPVPVEVGIKCGKTWAG